MDDAKLVMGCQMYAVNILRGLGYKATADKAAAKLSYDAWKAHLKNGRTFEETFVIGMRNAQVKFAGHVLSLN